MELRHLRYFVAVAEHLHFGRAAHALQTAQPSLSQQIRQLERDVGVALLERSRHAVKLTPAGEIFLDEARALIGRAERSIALARDATEGSVGRVRLGFSLAALGATLVEGLRRFSAAQPSVALAPATAADRALIDDLLGERLDVAIAQTRPHGELAALGLQQRPFGGYRLAVALSHRHPLASRIELGVAALRGERLLLYARRLNEDLYASVLALCGEGGYGPPSMQEVEGEAALLVLCSAGFGAAIVPQPWDALGIVGCVFRPLVPEPPEIGLSVVWRSDARGGAVAAFVAELAPS